jgi:hypothetical protein
MKDVLLTFLIILASFFPGIAQNGDESLKPERIYLHTDRNIYMAGGYMFYSLYLQGNAGHLSKYAYLVLRDQYNSQISREKIEVSNQHAFGSIYLSDTLKTGIYQVICYTNCMRNDAERSWFNKEIVIANRFDQDMDLYHKEADAGISGNSPDQIFHTKTVKENLIIHLENRVFNSREKISFSIEASNMQGDTATRISVSISEILPCIPAEPSISVCFNDSSSMIVDGTTQRNCDFHAETYGTVLQGKVLALQQPGNQPDSVDRAAVNLRKAYTVMVSAADSIANMQYSLTDSLGSFGFILNPFYNGKELIIRLKENAEAVIAVDDKFNLNHPFKPSAVFNVPGIRAYLIRCGKITQVQRNYNDQMKIITQREFMPGTAIPRVYYKSTTMIVPADFLRLDDFIEISRELVPGFKVRKSKDDYVSGFIINSGEQPYASAEPAIFLDGVLIDDVNQIIHLGTDHIKRIETLPAIRYYGNMSFIGILAVFSNRAEVNTIQFKTPTIKYTSLSSQHWTKPEPFKPAEDNNKYNPDLRQVLLWEPDIMLYKGEKIQIECYASDLQGTYLINAQGITSDGLPVNGSALFTIHNKSH